MILGLWGGGWQLGKYFKHRSARLAVREVLEHLGFDQVVTVTPQQLSC